MSFETVKIAKVRHPFFESLINDEPEIIFCEGQNTYTFNNGVETLLDHKDEDSWLRNELASLNAETYEALGNIENNEYVAFEFDTKKGPFLGVYFYENGKLCVIFRRDPANYVEADNDVRLEKLALLSESLEATV